MSIPRPGGENRKCGDFSWPYSLNERDSSIKALNASEKVRL
jgi:hypothetical protein